MDDRKTSNEIADGIGKFVFITLISFGLLNAVLQYWVIAVPLLVIAGLIYVIVASVREDGILKATVMWAGSFCFFYGLWLYFIRHDEFTSDKWPVIFIVCVISGIVGSWKSKAS